MAGRGQVANEPCFRQDEVFLARLDIELLNSSKVIDDICNTFHGFRRTSIGPPQYFFHWQAELRVSCWVLDALSLSYLLTWKE